MEYNEIRASMDSCRRNISALKKQIRSNVEEQQSCKNASRKIEENYQLELREQHKKALNAYLQDKTKDLEEQLSQKESAHQKLKQDYDDKKSELENKDISSLYTGSDDITAEIRASLAILQEQLSFAVSPRFQAVLEQQMQITHANLEISRVQEIIQYFNKQSKRIEKLSRSSFVDRLIDKLLSILKISLDDTSSKEGKIQISIIFVAVFVIMLLTAKVVFPIYFLFLIILFVYNIHKHYCIYSALIAQKVVKDNLALIESNLRDRANTKLKEEIKVIDNQFLPQLDQLNAEIMSLRDEISNVSLQETNNFHYDDSASRESYMNSQKINSRHLEELQEAAQGLNSQLQEKNQLYKELGKQLKTIAGDIQERYLNYNKIGESVIFDTQFIVDIENAKPIFFMHPKESCLFLYNKVDEVANFIKLLCVQLRIKMSPMNLLISVIDPEGLGVQYLPLDTSNSEDESIKQLFQIITDKSATKDFLEKSNSELDRKVGAILRNYNDIEEYNTAMVESDSLTESYNFIFYLDPALDDVKDSNLTTLLKNGGIVGIYTHLCINMQSFKEMQDSAAEIIKRVNTVYVLQNGSIYKKAKDFALENLVVHKK